MIPTRSLVYGYEPVQETLAFADGATAEAEAAEILALLACGTFGEARALTTTFLEKPWALDAEEYDGEADDPDYGDDVPLVMSELDSVADGDFPGMVAERAFLLLPAELQVQYGERVYTTFSGDYLSIPPAHEDALIAALRGRGFDVRRDDALIHTLGGHLDGWHGAPRGERPE